MDEIATVKENQATPAAPSRRRFFASALAATLGVSLADVMSQGELDAAPPGPSACPSTCTPIQPGQPFVPVAEFVRRPVGNPADVNLDVDMTVKAGCKYVTTIAGQGLQCRPMGLRYYEGRYPNNAALKWHPKPALTIWPANPELPGPGPTFRVRVGDRVRIHLANKIDPNVLPKTTTVEKKPDPMACDIQTGTDPATGGNIALYPQGEKMPSCLHGDNTTNLHFHGTHVTPDGHGDNVMIDVYPQGHVPPPHPGKPPNFSEFTNDFRIPLPPPAPNPLYPKEKMQMGQAPGTHWYHAHKHGSVALQLLNGMAGAFIIEGDFDDELEKLMPGLRETEKVLVIQQIGDQIMIQRQTQPQPSAQPGKPLNTCAGGDPRTLVNGQLQPTIAMLPGEIQRWRIINATMQQVSYLTYTFTGKSDPGYVPVIRQIAYDGIQIAPERYNDPSFGLAQQFTLAPANRVDILVQAPLTAGESLLSFTPVHPPPTAGCLSSTTIAPYLVQLSVTGSPKSPAMSFPTVDNFPRLPSWLQWNESDPILQTRKLQFNWWNSPNDPNYGQPAIDGKVFDDTLNTAQLVNLNAEEEWTLQNFWDSSIHPFHIHVNPFQVLEIFDPQNPPETQHTIMKPPYIWRDTIAIPASTGPLNNLTLGYVKIRSRFVDFPGTFVLHCHILDHEDRGMMQMVEICDTRLLACPSLPQHH